MVIRVLAQVDFMVIQEQVVQVEDQDSRVILESERVDSVDIQEQVV